MKELQDEYTGRAGVLIVNAGESESHVKGFLKEKGLDGMNVLLDEEYIASQRYLLRSIPYTVLIDKDGVVVDERVGTISLDVLKDAIDKEM